jgi:hypothetical protein
MLAEATVICRPGKIHPLGGSQMWLVNWCWLLAGDSAALHVYHSIGLLNVFIAWWLFFPIMSDPED